MSSGAWVPAGKRTTGGGGLCVSLDILYDYTTGQEDRRQETGYKVHLPIEKTRRQEDKRQETGDRQDPENKYTYYLWHVILTTAQSTSILIDHLSSTLYEINLLNHIKL